MSCFDSAISPAFPCDHEQLFIYHPQPHGIVFNFKPFRGCCPEKTKYRHVFSDGQGVHDVGCYGCEIPTPHIDSLHKDGINLVQF
ncbi:MAG TPA: hypothetical protein DCX10_06900 [Verrucomicrobiales bacterium]|nr:hypothetical protein [Verrucomicrobiales bacterium]